jgi:predicted nuclease with RNAse H fold
VRSLGLDVGVRKGLDLVLMDEDLSPVETRRRIETASLEGHIAELEPDVVAIDSPPAWGKDGRSRRTERELRALGIQSYGTPSDPKKGDNAFYAWMKAGFAAFDAAARCGFERFRSGRAKGTALEVFPHASAVVLAGCLPPHAISKREWRAQVLRSQGVHVRGLRSADQIDAALAALTGLFALKGRSTSLGDPWEGVIVLPASSLPARPYRRCRHEQRTGEIQLHFPGLARCSCGDPACDRMTASEFAPGHDAKRKSLLWKLAREGQDAVDELRRRGWEVPPEMK